MTLITKQVGARTYEVLVNEQGEFYHRPCGKWFPLFDAGSGNRFMSRNTWMSHHCPGVSAHPEWDALRAKLLECEGFVGVER